MQYFLDRIRIAVAEATRTPPDQIRVEQPRDASKGDFAVPCFVLAKAANANPAQFAAELATKLAGDLIEMEIAVAGPFLNFRVERGELAKRTIESILDAGLSFGSSEEGRTKRIVIDMSSPNIAKPMSVGHLRSTVIGAAVKRLHKFLGFETFGINHIGDWGSQFGKLVAAVRRWGAGVDLEKDPIKALLDLYVRYHEEESKDPSLDEEARAAFRELESGVDGEVRAIWRRLTELSLAEFEKIYARLGVEFDLVRGEAYYETHLDATVQRIVDAGITEESQGALIVDLESIKKGMPPCLLRKTDGTTLYATRDLAAVFERWELHHFERCLYVVGMDQRLHFQQLKAVLKRLDLFWEPRVVHVDFGMLRLPEGKMSTRKGRVVFLDDVLDRAVQEARRIIVEKNPGLADLDRVAEQVGVGAVVFNDLKRERVKDIEFVWEEVLSFEGETGPYVQYTHARLSSILRKAKESGEGAVPPDWSAVGDAAAVLLTLGRFPQVVRSAAEHAEPSEVTQYLLGLCRETNTWYASTRVLGEAPPATAARLALVAAIQTVLATGLGLLGLAAPAEM